MWICKVPGTEWHSGDVHRVKVVFLYSPHQRKQLILNRLPPSVASGKLFLILLGAISALSYL